MVTNAHISDYLLGHPDGLHVAELARLSGIHEIKLSKILRLLATNHIYREGRNVVFLVNPVIRPVLVKQDVYTNNRMSIRLISADPISSLVDFRYDLDL